MSLAPSALLRLLSIAVVALGLTGRPAPALPPETLASVVSVLPVRPDAPKGNGDTRPGTAPEGSGVVLRPGIIATALHVVEPARRIDIRLSDGRVLPARLHARDSASDIALLRVDADLPAFEIAPRPGLADPVCALGNAWGLGLSVTCGVVSALDVTDAGFNPVEHFVQTDAATNPGMSGGALVDPQGRLVGMLSAIFAGQGDGNIGVNFAVSTALLQRVTEALLADGAVSYPDPGWRLAAPDRAQLARHAGAVVRGLAADGPAARGGVQAGDLVTAIDGRAVRSARDAGASLALLPPDAGRVTVDLLRDGAKITLALPLTAPAPPAPRAAGTQDAPQPPSAASTDGTAECPHPAPVCQMRQAVFPVSGFDPLGSATRIGPGLLVTNRHVVGDRSAVVVYTPGGPRDGQVVASAYAGDLALIAVDGLPADGKIVNPGASPALTGPTYAIGADVARQVVRVFAPGPVIAPPDEGAALGRLHVAARMQPGVSGGALVDADGVLLGINVGGGEGRFEAIPAGDIDRLQALRDAPEAAAITRRLGAALAQCAGLLDSLAPRDAAPAALANLRDTCAAADNPGQLLDAGRVLALAGAFEGAIALHGQAAAQVPNSLNARLSLLVSLQLAGRFEDMTGHARKAMALAPRDPQVLRFAIQSGVWGDAPALAEQAYRLLEEADPMQAGAARRFIDAAPPAPARR